MARKRRGKAAAATPGDLLHAIRVDRIGVGEACRRLGISVSTHHRWRRLNPEYAAQVDAVLAEPDHQRRMYEGRTGPLEDRTAPWFRQFIYLYRQCRDRVEAAKGVGMTALEIESALSPGSDTFCEELYNLYTEEIVSENMKMQDALRRKAVAGNRGAVEQVLGKLDPSEPHKEDLKRPSDQEGLEVLQKLLDSLAAPERKVAEDDPGLRPAEGGNKPSQLRRRKKGKAGSSAD